MNVNTIDLLALGVIFVLFFIVFRLRKMKVNFAVLTVLALIVGVAFGLAFKGNVAYVEPIGTIYVQVITAVVAPLIIVSILSSVTSLGNIRKLRTIGTSSVFWLLLSNLIAILLTLGLTLATGLGKNSSLNLTNVDGTLVSNLLVPLDQVLVGLFPSNIVGDIQGNKIVPIILFALLIAISYVLVANKDESKVLPFKQLVDATRLILFKAVGFIIELTPYAVLALVATSTSTAVSRLETVWSLMGVLALAFVACLIHSYVVNGVLLRVFAQVSPRAFFRKLIPAQSMAFTTQSSVGTLPVTINTLTHKVGVPDEVANFTAPLGTTIGMPGCAGIWPTLVAVFSVHALGINYGVGDYIVLVLLGLLISLGTAGVPGTAIITATAVLTAVGLPVEVMVLLVPISAVAGTVSTMTNVTVAATSATIVARRQGVLNDDVFAGIEPAILAPVGPSLEDEVAVLQPANFGGVFQPAGRLPLREPQVPVGACDI